ncbi:MAG: threonine--tRNA ligase, partial [Caldisericaceae bacterium]
MSERKARINGKDVSFQDKISVKDLFRLAGVSADAVAAKVNEKPVDTSFILEEDADVAPILSNSEEGEEIIRHSTSHILAQAVLHLFPEAKYTIGPAIEKGFYYDFDVENAWT